MGWGQTPWVRIPVLHLKSCAILIHHLNTLSLCSFICKMGKIAYSRDWQTMAHGTNLAHHIKNDLWGYRNATHLHTVYDWERLHDLQSPKYLLSVPLQKDSIGL